MDIKEFIEKAIEGGWGDGKQTYYKLGVGPIENNEILHLNVSSIFLDPEAWKAVGKVEGWDDGKFTSPTYKDPLMWMWHHNMHCMITALAEGKTISEFLSTLSR